jgi:hypothetical protein
VVGAGRAAGASGPTVWQASNARMQRLSAEARPSHLEGPDAQVKVVLVAAAPALVGVEVAGVVAGAAFGGMGRGGKGRRRWSEGRCGRGAARLSVGSRGPGRMGEGVARCEAARDDAQPEAGGRRPEPNAPPPGQLRVPRPTENPSLRQQIMPSPNSAQPDQRRTCRWCGRRRCPPGRRGSGRGSLRSRPSRPRGRSGPRSSACARARAPLGGGAGGESQCGRGWGRAGDWPASTSGRARPAACERGGACRGQWPLSCEGECK